MDFRIQKANTFNLSSGKNFQRSYPYRLLARVFQLVSLTLLLSACGGGNSGLPVTQQSGDTTAVKALPDSATTPQNTAVTIPVLSNDSGINGGIINLSINQQPANGSVIINTDKTITYTPSSNFSGTDSFAYKITKDASLAITTVTISISCPTCQPDIKLSLAWQPSGIDNNIGYLVYFGTSENNVNTIAYDLTTNTGLNPSSPRVELSAKNDLQLGLGDKVCFRIQAYNDATVSDLSSAVCGIL